MKRESQRLVDERGSDGPPDPDCLDRTHARASLVVRAMNIRPVFAWFDLWIGVFIDRPQKRIYVFPIPCIGFVVDYGGRKQP